MAAEQTTTVRTIRPGELHADNLNGRDAAIVSAVMREAPALARQLAKGGLTALWIVVLVLVCTQVALGATIWAHANDNTTSRQGKVIEWLALCEIARQNGREPPPPPLFLLQGGL